MERCPAPPASSVHREQSPVPPASVRVHLGLVPAAFAAPAPCPAPESTCPLLSVDGSRFYPWACEKMLLARSFTPTFSLSRDRRVRQALSTKRLSDHVAVDSSSAASTPRLTRRKARETVAASASLTGEWWRPWAAVCPGHLWLLEAWRISRLDHPSNGCLVNQSGEAPIGR